ncbi:hypothetical protein [Actinocorallia longicatena]|uniref:Mce-associated membrane protein n=1 Tax=Actinocorallia longicatena TaxID=111803 RepID=A0ABP6Q1T3_9ACTN
MDLTNDRQRKLLFAGIAAALVVLGLWLVWPRPDTTPRPKDALPSLPAAATGPASPIPGITASVAPDSFDIYRLLPFNKKEFATAASVAQQFTAVYGTYRYDEAPDTYLGRFAPYAGEQVLRDLRAGLPSPAMIEDRNAKKTVAVGSASLSRVREFGDTSITFEVEGRQQITENGVAAQDTNPLAVTVQFNGGSWKVYSFAPADKGDFGQGQP